MKFTDSVKRKLVQIAAFGFTNSHIGNFSKGALYTGPWKYFCNPGLNCYSCPAASFACPIGALQAVTGSMNYDISFYVTGFLLAVGVLMGRFVCGWICPFGLIQEILHKIPHREMKLHKAFKWIKYVILAVFVVILPVALTNYMGMGKPAFCQFICPSGTLLGGLPLLGTHAELRNTIGCLFGLKVCILVLVLAGSIVTFRFFCKVMCPLGAIYGLLNKVSLYHLSVDRDQCVECGKCITICKMDVNPLENPDSAECIRCGACASACPKKAIHLGFCNTKKRTMSFMKGETSNGKMEER